MAQGDGDGGSVLGAVADEGAGDSMDESVGDGLGLWGALTTELAGVASTGLVVTRLSDPGAIDPQPIAAMTTKVATGARNRIFTMPLETHLSGVGFSCRRLAHDLTILCIIRKEETALPLPAADVRSGVRKVAILAALVLLAGTACASKAPALGPSRPSLWQGADLPGMHSGWRAAAYDQPRDCLWIVSRVPTAVGPVDSVLLTRLNLRDRSVVDTGLQMDADNFVGAWVALDAQDNVWMAWGRSIRRYEPDSHVLRTFALPSFASYGLAGPRYAALDGDFVGMVIDPAGEIWVAAYNIPAVFGFNPGSTTWDRMVRLIWFNPYTFTSIAAPQPGVLLVNGYYSPVANEYVPVFAQVNTTTGVVTDLKQRVREFGIVNPHEAVFIDSSPDFVTFNLWTFDLDTREASLLVKGAPVNANGVRFTFDSRGDAWFSMVGYRNVGLGKVDLTTGSINVYPFPYIDRPGVAIPTLPNSCPSGAFDCIPSNAVLLAGVHAITLDSNGNVWVVTDFPGSGDPYEHAPMAPVVELKVGRHDASR